MAIMAVDPETQADLQWSASQFGSMPGDFVSYRDSNRCPLPMIPQQVETQFFCSQPFPVCLLQVYLLHHHQHQSYAGVANANTVTWKP